jgi:hypothetical protein
MEVLSVSLFLAGLLFLVLLGFLTLLWGVFADRPDDFPLHRSRWVRPASALALLLVAQGWLVIAPSQGVAVLMCFGFILAAAVFAVPRGRTGT